MSLDGLRQAAGMKASEGTSAAGAVIGGILDQPRAAIANLFPSDQSVTGAKAEPAKPKSTAQESLEVLQKVQAAAGAVSGLLGTLDSVVDLGFAALASPLAKILPSLPSATIGSLYVGTPHTHVHPPSLIPPAPPVPLPSLGSVLLGISVQVLLGGMPAARVGNKGLAPTCGGLTPFFEIKLGSSNVYIGGKRAIRIGDLCKACEPAPPPKPPSPAVASSMIGKAAKAANTAGKVMDKAGKVAKAAGKAADVLEVATADDPAAVAAAKALQAAMQAAQQASDAAAAAALVVDPGGPPSIGAIVMPGAPTVMIGGFPMIPMENLASGAFNKLRARTPKAPTRTSAGPKN